MPLTAQFFAAVKSSGLFPVLYQGQVDSLNAIATVFDAFTGHDHCPDDLAYIMATCYAECGRALDLAIEEIGKGAGKKYGLAVGPYNKRYYGRGPPQVTWDYNYQKAKLRTGIDFYQFPELMCEPSKGIVYMIDAMYGGLFTGKALRTYIKPGVKTSFAAFGECRRIINGVDRKDAIAAVAVKFQSALAGGYVPPVKGPPPAIAPQQTLLQRLAAGIAALFGRK